jgi:hypothetical protein
MICIKLVEKGTQNSCLPRSHFSRQGNESTTAVDAVQKMCKGFLVVLAQKDKAGVGGQVKRLFLEAVKVEVHQSTPLNTFPSSGYFFEFEDKPNPFKSRGQVVEVTRLPEELRQF